MKYEYKLVKVENVGSEVNVSAELNTYSKHGWRVVSFERSPARPWYEVLLERQNNPYARPV